MSYVDVGRRVRVRQTRASSTSYESAQPRNIHNDFPHVQRCIHKRDSSTVGLDIASRKAVLSWASLSSGARLSVAGPVPGANCATSCSTRAIVVLYRSLAGDGIAVRLPESSVSFRCPASRTMPCRTMLSFIMRISPCRFSKAFTMFISEIGLDFGARRAHSALLILHL